MSKRRDQAIKIPGRYVPIRHEILDAPAWKAMSMGARMLDIALQRRMYFKDNNNGRIHMSTREGAAGAWRATGHRSRLAARSSEHYGFIVPTIRHSLGVDGKGKATHYRLTDWREGNGRSIEGTKDYLKWDGNCCSQPPKQPPPKIKKPTPKKTKPRDTPCLRVRQTMSHTPETDHVSGKPETETDHVSYSGPGLRHDRVSFSR